MTRDEAAADYAAHVERNGGTSIFTEDEHFTRAWDWVPGYEPGPGRDPGLFGGWTMP